MYWIQCILQKAAGGKHARVDIAVEVTMCTFNVLVLELSQLLTV